MSDQNTELTHEQSVDALLAKMREFLITPAYDQDGGWPTIDWKLIHEAEDLTLDLVKIKWGMDVDNDLPIKVKFINRKVEYSPWDITLDHRPDNESLVQLEARLLRNLRMTNGAINAYSESARGIQHELDSLFLKRIKKAAAIKIVLVTYEKNDEWNAGKFTHDRPSSIHATEADADNFNPEGFVKTRKDWCAATPTKGDFESKFKEYFTELDTLYNAVLPARESISSKGVSFISLIEKYTPAIDASQPKANKP